MYSPDDATVLTQAVPQPLLDAQEELTAWRHDLHRHPELAFEETRTASFVAEHLRKAGIDCVEGIGGTGVVGILRKGRSGRAIGLRADMDALPMREGNRFAHRSTVDGKFHGCGHDGHTVMLLAAARHLAQAGRFDGTVFAIFQPAEENAGGGKAMIDDGLFDRFPMSAVFGLHNYPGLGVGRFAIRKGPMMASFDSFDIVVRGEGGHGAFPHLATDALTAAAHMVTALNGLVPKRIDALDPAVVSVTRIAAGQTYNVIPDCAELAGAVRTLSDTARDRLESQLGHMASAIAGAHCTRTELRYRRAYPVLVNDGVETARAVAAAAALVGANRVDAHHPPIMGSEDFAFMLAACPGAYMLIGNGDGEGACMVHNPHYDFNDTILPLGAAYWARLAEQALSQA